MTQTRAQKAASGRKHYAAHKEAVKVRAQVYRNQNRRRLQAHCREHKARYGCADCGIDNWVVLEFDHVRGEKTANVADLVGRSVGLAKLQEEIAKCDVVCRNCHAIRTHARGGGTVPL